MRVVYATCFLVVGVLTLGPTTFGAATAHAQDDLNNLEREAAGREAFAEGNRAFDEEHYEIALEHFQDAYDLTRLEAFLFNMASCLDRLGRTREAVTHYEAYLAAVPDSERVGYVHSRVRILRELNTGEQVQSTTEAETEGESTTPRPIPQPGPSLVGPAIVLGAGAVVALSSLIFGLQALAIDSDLEAACPSGMCPDSQQEEAKSMDRLAVTSDIFLFSGAAILVGGAVWLAVGLGGAEEAPSASAFCSGDGCAATLQGQF